VPPRSRKGNGAEPLGFEDVLWKAADKLRAAGYEVVGVAALVDRLEGGRQNLEAAGLQVVALYTRNDFTEEALSQEG